MTDCCNNNDDLCLPRCSSMFLLASDSSSPGDEDDHQPSSNTTVTSREDERRLVSAFALRNNDVLFGRGSGPNGFSGNVRYRNMIRSILIKVFDFHNDDDEGDASVVDDDDHSDAALEFVVFPDNVKDMSLARRHRILATQVVKAIKSRHGRFLQQVPGAPTSSQQRKHRRSRSSGASSLDDDDTAFSQHPRIERRMYQIVEDSIAIEKTKQNFRDQMRLLEIEHGIRQAPTTSSSTAGSSREEHHHRSRVLSPSQANPPVTVSLSSVKRKRREDDYCSLSSESFNAMNKRIRGGFLVSSSHKDLEEIYHHKNRAFSNHSSCAIPLPRTTTTAHSFHSLRPSSIPCDSYQNDFITMERGGGVLLSRVASSSLSSRMVNLSREQRSLPLRHHHHSPTTQPCILLPEVQQLIRCNAGPRSMIEPTDLGTKMKPNMMIHSHDTYVNKAEDHNLLLRRQPHYLSNNSLPLDQIRTVKRPLDRSHETSLFSRRLVASPTRVTTLPNSIMSIMNNRSDKNNNHHCSMLEEEARPVMAKATSATKEGVEAMIASHQTRRDRFWMGWARVSNATRTTTTTTKQLPNFGYFD